ncbi:hypothetical protein KC878_01075 [Candidatus Saccharibacteria bacterium]|nr:hypothetical protein [Candidatus Saccharibacteria bacterium]MCB9821156.1 hypothetical protein [Candidatus Nomurabacteria bacterium]
MPYKKKDTKISNAQAYLKSTDTVSRPTAIIMSLLTFLAVFAVVLSLFLGGKWLYDRQNNNSSSSTSTTQSTSSNTETDNSSKVTSNSAGNDGLGITVIDGDGEKIASRVGEQFNKSTTTSTDKPASTPVVKTDTLPRTGPANNLLIAVGVVVIVSASHSLYARRR